MTSMTEKKSQEEEPEV